MQEIFLAVLVLTGIVMTLSIVILLVRSLMMGSGEVSLEVNKQRHLTVPIGSNLLQTLATAGIHVPAVCGGRGTCGQCRVRVPVGRGGVLPTETALITRRDLVKGVRLACQVILRQDAGIQVAEEIFGVREWTCSVRSNRNVTAFIKEVVLELREDETMNFRAGSYVLIKCPPYETSFRDFPIDDEFRGEWDRHNLWRHRAGTQETTLRAYSMANYPDERRVVILNVRIAPPPPGAAEGVPAGVVSSYIFSLKPGQEVSVLGPYGHFFAKRSRREMVFLGGGAGMAPMRSHILDQLKRVKTDRKITFWYGGRGLKDLFYVDEFNRLATQHDNFGWTAVLSEPDPSDHWTGYKGFVHKAAYDHYLKDHPAPEDCEYYVCGPPMMNKAVLKMLDDLGVDPEDILLDDFGGNTSSAAGKESW